MHVFWSMYLGPAMGGGGRGPTRPCPAALIGKHYIRKTNSGGEGYSIVSRQCHLTFDRSPLSGRSTVPTPKRDASNIWVLDRFFPYTINPVHIKVLLIASPSWFTACGRHLFPRMSIVFPLLSSVSNFPLVTFRLFPSFPLLKHPVPPIVHFTCSYYYGGP